jgi:hypothetical protein
MLLLIWPQQLMMISLNISGLHTVYVSNYTDIHILNFLGPQENWNLGRASLPSPLFMGCLHPRPPNPKKFTQMLRVQMK